MRIFKNKWFVRYARKEKIDDDALREAISQAENGLIDADLGGGLIKQRVARKGEGRSGGFRTIIAFRKGDKAFFVYGFAKNEMDNVGVSDLRLLKGQARKYLALNVVEIQTLIENGMMQEVFDDGKNL